MDDDGGQGHDDLIGSATVDIGSLKQMGQIDLQLTKPFVGYAYEGGEGV